MRPTPACLKTPTPAQVIFYLPLFLTALGTTSHASLEDALIVGGVNVASTLLALVLVDRIGRRPLLIAGAAAPHLAHQRS